MLNKLIIPIVAVMLYCGSAFCDTIVFKTGKTRDGELRKDDNGQVVEQNGKVFLKTITGETAFDRAQIAEIKVTGQTGTQNQAAPVASQQITSGASAEARARESAGQFKEAFATLQNAVKQSPQAAISLGNDFQRIAYDLINRAKTESASDPERARNDYHTLWEAMSDATAQKLMGGPEVYARFTQNMQVELGNLAYQMSKQLDPNLKGKEAQALLQESVNANPSVTSRHLELAELAKYNHDYTTALAQYQQVVSAPGAPQDLVQKSQFGLSELRRVPGLNVPGTPAPQTAQATKPPVAPRPIQRPVATPAPAATESRPTGPKWKQVLWDVQHSSVFGQVKDFATSLGGGDNLAIIVGALIFIFVFWVIPYQVFKFMAGRGNVLAGQYRLLSKKIGLFALLPLLINGVRAHASVKNRCPFCNKGIDNIEQYSDLNFYACPHCHEAITPVYDMKDYVSHLIHHVEQDMKRHKGGNAEGMVEKDAMLKLVRAVLTMAIRRRASDLHLDPELEGAKIRARIDGLMYELVNLPRTISPAFTSAIKIMANLDISEKRVPQDGKISLWIDKADIDLRVNTSPAAMGEKVSIRVLNQKSIQVDPTRLGLEGENLEKFERSIHRPHGLVIVTGPSGSGKSTTLYVALNEINTGEKNIITIEDPIEYQLKGLSQMQVNPAANFTFATGLRSILRQDPDVIMVGEIRDSETAEIAIEAAMTGHLVFTTLHTIDAPTAFSRMADLGVEPRRLASAVICVIAMRLLRTICPECKKHYKPSKKDLETLGIATTAKDFTFVHGAGCDNCLNTGYYGRLGIYEFLTPDETMREILETNAAVSVIKELAKKAGYRTLREEGVIKVMQGITTVEEVIRVTS
jgi:type II secretory ATPase GspE/PulE/Tfp pilus assembly ATPase PilB-like protein